MTQLELAMSAEVERTRVSKLELGRVNASVLTLATICHVLNITLADLFGDIRLAHPPTTEGGPLRRANQAVLDKKPTAKRTKAPGKAAAK
ncbi:helix-turn-helix transcriptional regulator [Acidovorax sp. A79]|uniref:helix-turn-helix transcriptional regulator n=1 Tax=Acidovorax sp. A79 TaxID=3056107 RepID=UPI0034E83EA1